MNERKQNLNAPLMNLVKSSRRSKKRKQNVESEDIQQPLTNEEALKKASSLFFSLEKKIKSLRKDGKN
jgi:hypothetical protein